MSALLFSSEIRNAIDNELRSAQESVQIITAYCKESSLAHLNDCIPVNVQSRRLLVRFRMDDVLKGSTDFDILEYAVNNGWKVYIRFDLHAKTYVVDNKRGFVGSANLTNSGLSIGKSGNMEMATLVDIESDDVVKIEKLFNDAILVDANIINQLREQILSVNDSEKGQTHKWSDDIIEKFKPRIETLFSYELPEHVEISEGTYIQFLDLTYNGDKEDLKEALRWSNAYQWLLYTLEENGGVMQFGAITAKLHDALVSDPKPYRRDVKQMLSDLLSMIEMLDMDEVVIDRPNYSQRVRLVL